MWLVGHMARSQDIGVNRFVTDGEQVFVSGDWGRWPGVAGPDFGTGMTPADVLDLGAGIDISALR